VAGSPAPGNQNAIRRTTGTSRTAIQTLTAEKPHPCHIAPATTGELAAGLPELSRFAVMQHLAVLTDAGLVLPERRGRDRVNYLNPVPLREWYERWVQPLADTGAAELLALKRAAEKGTSAMSDEIEPIRTVRLAYDLRINASAEPTFEVMTQRLTETGNGAVRVHVVKVAAGPLTEEEAAGIAEHGDYRPFTAAVEKLAGR